jgi:hypothetical protein
MYKKIKDYEENRFIMRESHIGYGKSEYFITF